MFMSLGLAIAALRIGFSIRRARFARTSPPARARERHLRFARAAVYAIALGAIGGPLSSFFLRDWRPFSTFHGAIGLLCAALFAGVWVFGRRLERGDVSAREAHARFGAGAVLLALAAAFAGFVLLP